MPKSGHPCQAFFGLFTSPGSSSAAFAKGGGCASRVAPTSNTVRTHFTVTALTYPATQNTSDRAWRCQGGGPRRRSKATSAQLRSSRDGRLRPTARSPCPGPAPPRRSRRAFRRHAARRVGAAGARPHRSTSRAPQPRRGRAACARRRRVGPARARSAPGAPGGRGATRPAPAAAAGAPWQSVTMRRPRLSFEAIGGRPVSPVSAGVRSLSSA